jgi:hypothetical protein
MFCRPCFNRFSGMKYITRLFSDYMLTFRVESVQLSTILTPHLVSTEDQMCIFHPCIFLSSYNFSKSGYENTQPQTAVSCTKGIDVRNVSQSQRQGGLNRFSGMKYITRLFSDYMLTFRVEEPMKICVTN